MKMQFTKIGITGLVCLLFTLQTSAYTVMPLGNSITHGYGIDDDGVVGHYNYRPWLWKIIHEQGYAGLFDLVGDQNTYFRGEYDAPPFVITNWDKQHEGAAGATISGIADNYTQSSYTPHIVMVHAGTNDLRKTVNVSIDGEPLSSWPVQQSDLEQRAEQSVQALSTLIDNLRNKNPSIKILLAKLIPPKKEDQFITEELFDGREIIRCEPCGESWNYPATEIYNRKIDEVVVAKQSANSPIHVVDMWSGYNEMDWYIDHLHPDVQGSQFMAKRWFDGLMQSIGRAKVYSEASFNGDPYADLMFFQGSDNTIHVNTSRGFDMHGSGSGLWLGANAFGAKQDNYYPGDYNGDGKTDLAYFESNNTWHFRVSTGTAFTDQTNNPRLGPWGAHGSGRHLVGDFTGDGKDDIGYFEYSTNKFHVAVATDDWFIGETWVTGDCPNCFGHDGGRHYVGDFNGDGKDDLLFFEPFDNTIHVTISTGTGFGGPGTGRWLNPSAFGAKMDNYYPGDYNGDGKTDLAYFESNNSWHFRVSTGSGFTIDQTNNPSLGPWGAHGSGRHMVADFTGDGKDDIGYFEYSTNKFFVAVATDKWFDGQVWISGSCSDCFGHTNGRHYQSPRRE